MKVCLKIPVAAIASFDTSQSTVNRQIADILETFDYRSIPSGSNFGYNIRERDYKQLSIYMPKIVNDRLAKYCKLTGKSRTVALTQVLIVLGKCDE